MRSDASASVRVDNLRTLTTAPTPSPSAHAHRTAKPSLRLTVVALGSAGDLHPLLAIGRAMRERGHDVTVLSQAPHQSAVAAEGLVFHAVVDETVHARTMAHPRLWHPIDGFGVLWRHLAVPAMRPTIDYLLSRAGEVAPGGAPNVVLASPLAAGARLARARASDRLRLATAYTAPMGLRSVDDPMFLGAWRVPRALPRAARWALWHALDRWKLEPMARATLMREAQRAGVGGQIAGSLFGQWLHSPDGGLALYPEWFAPVPPHWAGAGVQQVGFPLFEPSASWPQSDALPPALASFLSAAAPFIVAYPGSAALHTPAFVERLRPALRALGMRMLLLSPHAPEGLLEPGDLALPHAPLPSVLGRAAAFVHHGGIGSTAQAFQAQVPQLILASAFDQFENGARVDALDAGRWRELRRATPPDLHAELRRLLGQSTGTSKPRPTLQHSTAGAPNDAVRRACDFLEQLARKPDSARSKPTQEPMPAHEA